ncbi:hypothetical protein [Paracraurococcus lichenis]|uniref:Uncharacterized protein n=1 Tax=Paracraurococcus lichenis TaxID=3064888 RepID=A0ABT9DZ98_9PROT|nr:hypothetical protein [Paracraurococcus sp. LOR1-02]MDO9709214.1 hypothetical protein [Paracraurococcus sp. LOR1-02]
MLSRRALLAALLAAAPMAAHAAAAVRPQPPDPPDTVQPVRGGARFGGSGRSHSRSGSRHFTRDYRFRQKSNRF